MSLMSLNGFQLVVTKLANLDMLKKLMGILYSSLDCMSTKRVIKLGTYQVNTENKILGTTPVINGHRGFVFLNGRKCSK